MRHQIALAIVLLSIAGAASADPGRTSDERNHQKQHKVTAPEIDPAAAIAAMTLLAGGLAVLRGRRFKNLAK